MSERMSEATWKNLKQPLSDDTLDYAERIDILEELDRARANEERLQSDNDALREQVKALRKRVHELGVERGQVHTPPAMREEFRRIVREEMRNVQIDVTAKHGYCALGSMRIVEQPFAGAMWPDEEATNETLHR